MVVDIPDDRRCQAIGWRSRTQCKQRSLKGSEFCSFHSKAPTLPPEERTSLPELIAALEASREPQKRPSPSRTIDPVAYAEHPVDYLIICRGTPRENIVPRCTAKSKRSGKRCRNASCRVKQVCRMHGGVSRGPKSTENCGAHFLTHGRETREIRRRRKQINAEFRIVERVLAEYELLV